MPSEADQGNQNVIEMNVEDVGSIPHITVGAFALFSRVEFALLAAGYSGGER